MLDLPFANHTTYPGHSGVDFPYRSGTPILASGAGTVTRAGWINNRAGYGVVIAYDRGPDVLYCHMRAAFYPPTRVRYGTVIGEVGSTGNSTGPHLHMEIVRGTGSHTYAGIWRYFSKTNVIENVPIPAESKAEHEERVHGMRGIYNVENPDEQTRRALVGETTFQVISDWYSQSQWEVWGAPVNVTQEEWDATRALVEQRNKGARHVTE